MKITIKQLRRLIREEIIKEYDPMKGPFWNEDEDFDEDDSDELNHDLPNFGIHGNGERKSQC